MITREANVLISISKKESDQFKSTIKSEFERLKMAYISVEHLPIKENEDRVSNLLLSVDLVNDNDQLPFDRSSTLKVCFYLFIFIYLIFYYFYNLLNFFFIILNNKLKIKIN